MGDGLLYIGRQLSSLGETVGQWGTALAKQRFELRKARVSDELMQATLKLHGTYRKWQKENLFTQNPELTGMKDENGAPMSYWDAVQNSFQKKMGEASEQIAGEISDPAARQGFQKYFMQDFLPGEGDQLNSVVVDLERKDLYARHKSSLAQAIQAGDTALADTISRAANPFIISPDEALKDRATASYQIAFGKKAQAVLSLPYDQAMTELSKDENWSFTDFDGKSQSISSADRAALAKQIEDARKARIAEEKAALEQMDLEANKEFEQVMVKNRFNPVAARNSLWDPSKRYAQRMSPESFRTADNFLRSLIGELSKGDPGSSTPGPWLDRVRMMFSNDMLITEGTHGFRSWLMQNTGPDPVTGQMRVAPKDAQSYLEKCADRDKYLRPELRDAQNRITSFFQIRLDAVKKDPQKTADLQRQQEKAFDDLYTAIDEINTSDLRSRGSADQVKKAADNIVDQILKPFHVGFIEDLNFKLNEHANNPAQELLRRIDNGELIGREDNYKEQINQLQQGHQKMLSDYYGWKPNEYEIISYPGGVTAFRKDGFRYRFMYDPKTNDEKLMIWKSRGYEVLGMDPKTGRPVYGQPIDGEWIPAPIQTNEEKIIEKARQATNIQDLVGISKELKQPIESVSQAIQKYNEQKHRGPVAAIGKAIMSQARGSVPYLIRSWFEEFAAGKKTIKAKELDEFAKLHNMNPADVLQMAIDKGLKVEQ